MPTWDDQLAALNALAGVDRSAALPDDVRGWRPTGATIPEPVALHGFASTDAPRVLGRWVAMARKWATPDSPDLARSGDVEKLAVSYAARLAVPKFWPGVYESWEKLMELFRDGSNLRPVPWAWWRIKNYPAASVYAVFSSKVLELGWKRAKFWEEEGSKFKERVRLYPKVSLDLATAQRTARVTGVVPETWGFLREEETAQRRKIEARLQQAWGGSNLALWLADGDELTDALRLKTVAVSTFQAI